MRLTRKKAIELCIEAWTILAKTGCTKEELPGKHQGINCDCWFCEYDHQKSPNIKCVKCLFPGDDSLRCLEIKAFTKWDDAKQTRTRKKYAKLFLKQIEALQK